MDRDAMLSLADRFLAAWNTQEVEQVLACYTTDVDYRDPNTRGSVRGGEALGRYLTKLFGGWKMHWSLREAHLFEGGGGCAVMWHATFRRPDGTLTVGIDGMDLVEVRENRIARNEVCFDRTQLAPLLAAA